MRTQAADQTTCFEEFHLHYSNGNPGSIVLDDRRELKLVLEVADIIDELNMIQYLLRQQRDVLQSLIRLLREHKPSAPQPDRETSVTFSDVNMRGNASVLINFHQQPGSSYEIENTKALAKGIDGIARDHVVAADEKLLSLRAEIDVIIGDAGNVHKMGFRSYIFYACRVSADENSFSLYWISSRKRQVC